MHIIVGKISAHYSGRGDTLLSPYDRIMVHKNDGTVSIHSDKGYKPLNYMSSSTLLEKKTNEHNQQVWTFNSKDETLAITFHEIYDEINLSLGDQDPGHIQRIGTESQLQKWILENLPNLDQTLIPLEREYQTGAGPVDILAKRQDILVPVEVKRVAPMNTVGQILRYVDAMEEKHPTVRIEGAIAAVEFKARTLELAKKKNIQCITIPSDWILTGHEEVQTPELPINRLF